jgi:hypothetical protein
MDLVVICYCLCMWCHCLRQKPKYRTTSSSSTE